MSRIELDLARRGELPEFERTRAFYRSLGYEEEARIRSFYQAGEDKIVYRKLLEADHPTHADDWRAAAIG